MRVTTSEHDYKASIFSNKDGMYYIDYEHGKCVRDGWSRPHLRRTGESAKLNFDGKIVEKPIWLLDGQEVIRHNNQIIQVQR
jgi:hypothetical protein